SAEQQPGGDGAGATQVELEPVQVLRRGDAPARERALRSADALNDLLRRLVTRQVQVQTVVRMAPSGLTLQPAERLGQPLTGRRHRLEQQQRVRQAVALGQVPAHPDSARLLSSYEDVALQHRVDDVFEADGSLDDLEAPRGGETLDDAADRERLDDPAGSPFTHEVVEQHGE